MILFIGVHALVCSGNFRMSFKQVLYVSLLLLCFPEFSYSQGKQEGVLSSLFKKTASKKEDPPRLAYSSASYGLPTDLPAALTVVFDMNHDRYPDLMFFHFFSEKAYAFLNQRGKKFTPLKIKGVELKPFERFEFVRGLYGDERVGAVLIKTGSKNPLVHGSLQFFTAEVRDDALVFETYKEFPELKGLDQLSDVLFVDDNMDGLLDIFVSRWYSYSPRQSNEEAMGPVYLRAVREKGAVIYKDLTKEVGLKQTSLPLTAQSSAVPNFELSACDINNDSKLEILYPGYGRRWNQMHQLQPNGQYKNIARELGYHGDNNGQNHHLENGNSYTAVCADADNDGHFDLFQGEITHEWAGSKSDLSAMLWNRFPKVFLRDFNFPRPNKFKNQGDLGADFGDVDLDGWQDLLVGNTDYPPETTLLLWHQKSPRVFEDWSKSFQPTITNPQGVVFFDMDLDGDLDVLTAQSPMRAPANFVLGIHLFKNHLIEESKDPMSWLEIILDGRAYGAPYTPVGTRVEVTLPSGQKLARMLLPSNGRLTQRPETLHFGLGHTVKEFDHVPVEIKWPGGKVRSFKTMVNRVLKID